MGQGLTKYVDGHNSVPTAYDRAEPVHTIAMRVEKHRARRHRFVVPVEVVEVDLGKQLMAHTKNLSAFGCFIDTAAPFPRGTRIRLRINHRGSTFATLGKVADSQSNGMGVQFGKIEPVHQQILDSWLTQLRSDEEACSPLESGDSR